jgi:chromate transporter
VIAIIARALFGLLRTAIRNAWLGLLAVAALVAYLLGVNELLVLFGAGALALATAGRKARSSLGNAPQAVPLAFGAVAAAASAPTCAALFGVFFKIGSVLFGSGYVLLAFLRADLVQRLGWLTESQLIDAIAVGQVTPGPVFTTATFIGYVLAGPSGALAATLGIFLPAFLFVALSGPIVPKLRASATAGAFLDGVNVASLALMAIVTAQLGAAAVIDLPTVLIAALSALVLVRFRVNATWLVLGGAALGWAAHTLHLAA